MARLTKVHTMKTEPKEWTEQLRADPLPWFKSNQEEGGLWPTGYGKGKKAQEVKLWVGLAVCRVLKRFYQANKCRIPVRQVSSKTARSVVQ